ncbi:flagellar export protein FliJ [Campylobacter sp. 9BO]|uniref:flagellar export protein FliJ n=1 Tax=Campylobacter sp. 9BO TaxID=3424759 RepID=UPI003D348977
MKSKFTPVVSVKKQALDRLESKVAMARANIARKKAELQEAQNAANAYQMPTQGSMSELRESLEILRIMNDELKTIKAELNIAGRELTHFTHQYKNASLEFEKMKFLEQEDIKAVLKKKKRDEELALDEFATMKFAQGLKQNG